MKSRKHLWAAVLLLSSTTFSVPAAASSRIIDGFNSWQYYYFHQTAGGTADYQVVFDQNRYHANGALRIEYASLSTYTDLIAKVGEVMDWQGCTALSIWTKSAGDPNTELWFLLEDQDGDIFYCKPAGALLNTTWAEASCLLTDFQDFDGSGDGVLDLSQLVTWRLKLQNIFGQPAGSGTLYLDFFTRQDDETDDGQGPTLSHLSPSSGGVGHYAHQPIHVHIQDNASAVDPSSVELTVNNVSYDFANTSGALRWNAPFLSFRPQSVVAGDGNPPRSGPVKFGRDEQVDVQLSVRDLAGNDSPGVSWSFTVDLETYRDKEVLFFDDFNGALDQFSHYFVTDPPSLFSTEQAPGQLLIAIPDPDLYGSTRGAAVGVIDPTWQDYTVQVKVQVAEQLRDQPNFWEVAWLFFRMPGFSTFPFYYFIYKTIDVNYPDTGVEFGVKTSAWGQTFLATAAKKPELVIGQWYDYRITVNQYQMTAWIDGENSITLVDDSQQAATGGVGLYGEDAKVNFDDLIVYQPDSQNPLAPTELNVTALSATSLQVTWNEAQDNGVIWGYQLDVATDGSFTDYVNSWENADVGWTHNIDIPSLSVDTEYWVRLRSVDGAGLISDDSQVVSAKTAKEVVDGGSNGQGGSAGASASGGAGTGGVMATPSEPNDGCSCSLPAKRRLPTGPVGVLCCLGLAWLARSRRRYLYGHTV